MNEVIEHSFRCIIEELKVGKFTEKELRFILDMSKAIMEATAKVIAKNLSEEKKDIPAGSHSGGGGHGGHGGGE